MSTVRNNVTILLWCFYTLVCISQNQYAQWRFGNRAGVHFLNGNPIAVYGSIMNAGYSSASFSDTSGNLLFYVRGGEIAYNNQNDTMANGFDLGGSFTPQSGIIVPKSGSEYYIFLHNSYGYQQNTSMTKYAIVNMGLAAGLGSVTVKNQPISPPGLPMVSKLAVSPHCNNTDYWLLAHEGGFPGSNKYYAYQISSVGVSTNPVISAVGSNQPQGYIPAHHFYSGMHKFSPNGRKVAATLPYNTLELYDFDPSTGLLSNPIKLDSGAIITPTLAVTEENYRSIEFSPDGTKLYARSIKAGSFIKIVQFDLNQSTIQNVKQSKTIISIDSGFFNPNYPYPLQLAPNNKIYSTGSNSVHLDVINQPNLPSVSCSYFPQAVYIGTINANQYNTSLVADLPNSISNVLEQKPVLPSLNGSIVCGVVSYSAPVLSAIAGYSVTSYSWNFNDPLSGSNTSTLSNPTHTFSANGTYTVKLALNYHPCGTDTLKQVINITGLPTFSVTGKTTICKGESTVLNFLGADSYTLNTGAITQATAQLQPTITTVYTVTAKDNSSGCSSLKTLTITVLPCAGISETSLSQGLRVYPNPNSGVFTFETPEACEIKIYNSLGQEVFRASLSAGTSLIDISQEAKGFYLLEWSKRESKGQVKILIE